MFWKYSWNWTKRSPKSLFFQYVHGVRRGAKVGQWAGHTIVRRGTPLAIHHVMWAPQAPTDIALPPIYSVPWENPKYPKISIAAIIVKPSLGGSKALPDNLPERGIITGGLFITMPAFGVMREYFILGLRVYSSS